MNARGIVFSEDNQKVLMVRQYTKRGDIVWNFPGGGLEEGETFEEACIRELKEETGYTVEIIRLIFNKDNSKKTFLCRVVSGTLELDKEMECNKDMLEVAWVPFDDQEKFDHVTRPLFQLAMRDTKKDFKVS